MAHGSTALDGTTSRFGDLPWAARAIAPSRNEKVGPAIRLGNVRRVVAGGSGRVVTLRATLELRQPFPVSSGYLALEGVEDASLRVNGEPVGLECGREHGSTRWAYLWGHLVSGENTLELTVKDGDELALALLMRDVDESGDATTMSIGDDDWSAEGGTLVHVGSGPDRDLFDRPRRSVELRKTLPAMKGVTKAILTLGGPTLRDVRLNGRAVTDRVLEPGWTDYRKRLTRTQYDVTDLLAEAGEGEVEWTMTLGNGWFTGGMGWQHLGRFACRNTPLWIAGELEVEYDGGAAMYPTDETWAWRRSSTYHDTLYDGEHRDAAAVGATWESVAAFDPDTSLIVGDPIGPAIEVVETLRPISVDRREDGRFVIDFGQNHTGVCSVDLTGVPAGSQLRLRHAELVDRDGELEMIFLRTARVTDRLTVGDGETEWTPRFVYHGFRYAELLGVPAAWSSPDISGRVRSKIVHTAVPPAGDFESSDPLLNQIWGAVRWGIRSNLHSTMTDCPQRDERLGWTGDAQIIAETAPWFFDMRGMYHKYLLDILDAQREDGGVPNVAPATVTVDVSMAWADAIVAMPWAMWQHYGDRGALELAYPGIVKWLGYLNAHEEDGRCTVPTFGDWVPVVETPRELVAQAWSVWSARLGSKIAQVLGKTDDSSRFAADAERRGAWFHERYFATESNRYQPDTQTAQVLPLAFGITPADKVPAVRAALAENVRANDGRVTVGFCGAPLIGQVLSEAGEHELALNLLKTREKPSLGYMIDHGATTVWERWDSDTSGPEMNSRNHFAYGSMARWLFEGLAGLKVYREGSDPSPRLRLEPRPAGDIKHVSISRELAEGEVRLRWEGDADRFAVTGVVPDGVMAVLNWPLQAAPSSMSGVESLPDGSYRVRGEFSIRS